MPTVTMREARSNLPRSVESGSESEIIILRKGRPAARLVAVGRRSAGLRIGVAKGKFTVPETIDVDASTIVALFNGTTE